MEQPTSFLGWLVLVIMNAVLTAIYYLVVVGIFGFGGWLLLIIWDRLTGSKFSEFGNKQSEPSPVEEKPAANGDTKVAQTPAKKPRKRRTAKSASAPAAEETPKRGKTAAAT
jgi:cytoskeletal protein RodZ